MNEKNRKMIAEALKVDESSRNIRFILNALEGIGAGTIRKAGLYSDNGDKTINITAEDNTEYRVYLTQGGSLEGIKNLDNDKWEVQSYS